MLGWITEKLKTARDDSYLDPTNIRQVLQNTSGKLQKHLNYEQELRANKNRLDEINATGSALVEENHYAAPHIRERLGEVNGMWDELVDATAKKGAKLKEAGDQQLFNSDYHAHQDRVDVIGQQAKAFSDGGHFDAPMILRKEEALKSRYNALRDPLNRRKEKLAESLRGNQLFRDIDDELAWIREKEQIAGSSNRGRVCLIEPVS
ncbi:unnamed protein product [Gongylonema pulchrum]|uniref:Spectrin alpha chain-like n=1 Tax=Gongylonema pulchrum TaxID=637853 RepID=A0A183EWE8_9BILA|nr:unnamed protein product [Gongylonema pulchrum]